MKHSQKSVKSYQGYVSSERHNLVGGVSAMINVLTFLLHNYTTRFYKKVFLEGGAVWLASFPGSHVHEHFKFGESVVSFLMRT